MRIIITLIVFLTISLVRAQTPALAKNYYDQGEFEKSLAVYENLRRAQPARTDYLIGVVQNLQQLERFSEAEELLTNFMKTSRRFFPQLYVELGYNAKLQNRDQVAEQYYNQALESLTEANQSYSVAQTFQRYSLLEEAAKVYEKGMELNPKMDFNMQLAQIYGEQGKLEKMFGKYLDIIDRNEGFKHTAQRYFSMYITEVPTDDANDILRRILIRRSQKDQSLVYNELLSWLFIQQKEFKKALVQEKAIFRRNPENINRLVELVNAAVAEKDYASAAETANYIIENTDTPNLLLQAEQMLIDIQIQTAGPKDYEGIKKKFEHLISEYGSGADTYLLQIDYNHFIAFKMNKKDEAIKNLRTFLKEQISNFQEARVKMELADILVSNEKFNQALILYSQVQNKIQNNAISQEARFKVSRTSYYKGDFDWALTQLDVLKKSTSQLIANDAMQLSLLIKDNILEDSTHTALKKYARADLYDYQERPHDAIALLDDILTDHKGESIEDEALLKQGMIYEKIGEYTRAEENYLQIIRYYADDILADDALFRLAQLYENQLDDPEKAKQYYEQIVFNHADSIFYIEARKKFRMLRGDLIN